MSRHSIGGRCMLELKNIQATIYQDGIPLGGVKINPDGKPTCDWAALNNLSNEQRKELETLTKKLTEFLEVCAVAKEEFVAKETKQKDYKVIRKIGGEEAEVGMIRRDNKQLLFTSFMNEAEIQICLEQLDNQHITDFYYGGYHYDGD